MAVPPEHPKSSPTLTWTILQGLVPTLILLIGLLGFSNYVAARRQLLRGVERETGMLAKQAAENLGSFFARRREDALLLSAAPLIEDYLKNLDYGLTQEAEAYRLELSRYFARFARRGGLYSRISFVNLRGQEVAAGSAAGPEVLRAPPPGLEEVPKQGEVRASALPAERGGQLTNVVGFYSQGAFRGRVVVAYGVEHVRSLLEPYRVGVEGRAFLVGPSGAEFLASRKPFKSALTAEAAIADTPWRVRLEAKPEEFLAPLTGVQRWMTVISLAACFLMLLWVAAWVRSTVRPIEAMAEGTRRIAAGDLDYRFAPPDIRELVVLGEAFNDMARSLKERTRDLEARLRQLTALRDMENAVIERRDEEMVLRTCLEAAAKGLSLERVALYWVDAAKKQIVGRYVFGTEAMGLTEKAFQARRFPLGGGDILDDVVRTRQAVLVKSPAEDPRVSETVIKESKTREFVAAPVCGKDRVFAVFTADNYYSGRSLSESDKEGLSLFANAAGLALENSTLFQHLAESETRLRAVLENSPVAVLGLSREHWITTWNKGAEQIFGYPLAEMAGKPVTALFPPGSEAEFQRLLAELMEKGSVRDFPVPGRTKTGRRLDLSLSWGGAHRDFWLNKEWAVVIRDVSAGKRMEQQLIRSEKLAAVGQLISGIAHELNNPLQAVVGYAQMIAEGGRFNVEDMRQIFDNAMRCRKIIDNLLLFVRQGEVKKRPVRVEEAVRNSLSLLEYKLKKAASIQTSVSLPKGLPKVKADLQQIEQVFVNLINNACDAMSGWDGPKRLRIEARAVEGRVRIEVADTGPGVPKELRDRIFEPFFTTKPEGRGTGLGLTMCRQIVEDHGGVFGLHGGSGKGAVFWLELPAAAPGKTEDVRAPRVAARVKGRSVLLVDDEPSVLSWLRRVIEADGDDVTATASFAEAAAAAARQAFDLVVTDVRLGDGTGLELHEAWLSRSSHPRPDFLFLTGDVLNGELEQSLAGKNLPVLHKPVSLEDFRDAVRSILSRKAGRAGRSRRPAA